MKNFISSVILLPRFVLLYLSLNDMPEIQFILKEIIYIFWTFQIKSCFFILKLFKDLRIIKFIHTLYSDQL